MSDQELKPCPNPWCTETRTPIVVWHLSSKRVICPCGLKGPRSKTTANTTQGVPINDALAPKAEAEAITAWNTRPEVKVKPLVWGKLRETDDIAIYAQDSNTSIGHFIASDNGWFLLGQGGYHHSENIKEAKAAAQADYERRILSALQEGE